MEEPVNKNFSDYTSEIFEELGAEEIDYEGNEDTEQVDSEQLFKD